LVKEAKNHPDYIIDDSARNSELAVPIVSSGKVIGVIDSEHSFKGFFKERHRQAFHIIASFCGIKITEYYAKESIKKAQRAQEEMDRYKELDELKSRFITNISHDLKTPLSLIKAPAKQISQITTDKKVKVLSTYILNNADHLLRVVHQLLQLNRVDKGLNELYLETVNLKGISDKIRSQYEERSLTKNIQFNVDVDTSIEMSTDAFRLEQIIHNLLSNAFRYTPEEGKIVLRANQEGTFIHIDVSDNGSGIPAELHEKVFERFFKIDENNHEGTGIGLSLVKEYVDTLEGQVNIESAQQQGTTFHIVLPVQHSDFSEIVVTPEDNWQESSQINESKPLMLVVEDHTDLNNFICSYFEDKFLCISAFDGEEALKKIKDQLPDIVVTDLMMPKMTGNSLVEKIREIEEYHHIPIVVLSAKSKTDSKIDLYKMGVDNFIAKPFDIEELEIVVSSTIDQRRKVRDAFRKKYLAVPALDVINYDADEVVEVEEEPKLLIQAKDIVLQHIDNSSFNVVILAKALGLGRNRFQKEIKELTGITPVEFIRSIRLNEAKKMLNDPALSISEIAYSVGFGNLSYFTRSFKQEFGKLPSEYR
jgi:signal transduction histidine kinase/DNA-binding response OmpR family regulator